MTVAESTDSNDFVTVVSQDGNGDDFDDPENASASAATQPSAPLEVEPNNENSDNPRNSATTATTTTPEEDAFGPKGRWSTQLCQCTEVCFSPLWFMSWCCSCVVIAQLMTRLGLDWSGRPNPAGYPKTFRTILIILAVYFFLSCLGIGVILTIFIECYFLFLCIMTRGALRRRFQIPPNPNLNCLDGACEDLVCACCCPCCSSTQMIRHTHDTRRYEYVLHSTDGLPSFAPKLV